MGGTKNMERLFTIDEAAATLSVKPSTIRKWVFRRRLSYVKCGGAVRIPAAVLAEFVQRNTISAREA
jgi:excisionase family DNA binding protein